MFDKFAFKEKDKVKEIIKNGFNSYYATSDLSLLAAYYYQQGYIQSAVRDILLSFCSIHIKNFAYDIYYQPIDNALKKGLSRKIIHISKLPIYKEELEYIKNLGLDTRHSQLLFTIYCYKKLISLAYSVNNQKIGLLFGKSERQRKDIKKISCIKIKNNLEYQMMYHEFVLRGLFKPLSQGENFLTCFENMPQGKTLLYEVGYFDKIGLIYQHYIGNKKISICSHCGSPYKEYSHTKPTRLCQECSKYDKQNVIQKRCVDCGRIFFVSAKASKAIRCDKCQKRYNQNARKNLNVASKS